MKLNPNILLSFCTIIMFSSCQKDKPTDTNTSTDKVKSYTETITVPGQSNIVATYNMDYDANNRITHVTQSEIPGNKFSFSYPSETKYSMDLFEAGTLSIHEDFFLNSHSLPDSTFQYNDEEDTTTEKYLYNSDNQLITLKEYEYSSNYGSEIDNITTYTYNSDGNLAKATDTNNQVETFEYYPDLVYAMPLTNPFLSKGINSTKKANLLKTHTVMSNGFLVGKSESSYTFDSKKRISTITQTLDDGTVAIQAFTYF